MLKVYLTLILMVVISGGVAYHYYTVNGLQKDVSLLTQNNATLNQQVTSMQEAAVINETTIKNLNENLSNQIETIQRLTVTNNQIERERDEYVSIFRRHDLTELSRRRPGLIESRINSGTAEVFQDLIDTTTGVEDELNPQN